MKLKLYFFLFLFIPVCYATAGNSFSSSHYCYSAPDSDICRNHISIRSVDEDRENDFLVVPHRGLWGLKPGIPENSVPAIQAAKNANYIAVEMDILKVEDGFIGSHDFVFSRLTNSNSTDWMWQWTVSDLRNLYLKNRTGELTETHLMSLGDALGAISQNALVLMIDTRPPKAHIVNGKCVALCDYIDGSVKYDEAYMSNISGAISKAGDPNLRYLVFKVPFPVDYVSNHVGNFFEKVLWMPQINPTKLQWYLVNHGIRPPGYQVVLQDLIDFVNGWKSELDSISAWETAYKDVNDLRLQPFSIGDDHYDNILDYVIRDTGRRPGMFSGEPVGPRGLVNEFADWRMSPDPRADHIHIINFPGANHMVITTDRPDVWDKINSGE